MKSIALLAAASALLFAPAAGAADAGVDAAIHGFSDAFNKGDVAAARAFNVTAPTIVDEAPPHLWSGPGAFDRWVADLGKAEAAQGVSGGQVSLGEPTREVISGDRAYVVVPATYSFKQKGAAMREVAQITFVMARQGSAWKIASWTWTGPEASPAP